MTGKTSVLIVYAECSQADTHLRRSAEYAKSAVKALRAQGLSVAVFRDGSGDPECLHDHLSDDHALVVFYTHGCEEGRISSVGVSPDPVCRELCVSPPSGERRACARGCQDSVLLDSSQSHRLSGKTFYGATACYLGADFSDRAVGAGAKKTLGYADEYWSTEFEGQGENPFEAIATRGTECLASGDTANQVRQQLDKLHEYYANMERPGDVTEGDWTMLVGCLMHNRHCLRSRP